VTTLVPRPVRVPAGPDGAPPAEDLAEQDGGPVRVDTVDRAVAQLRAGRPVLVVDDADRENEGDVILAAALAEPYWIGWTVRRTSGVICAPMPEEIADALDLPAMVEDNQDPRRTAYTVSVDAREGITTGIGAADRTLTLRLLADARTSPRDLVRPGHVFPLRSRPGGVLERPGHTEAAVDLCRIAGLPPVGVIAEVVGDDGEPLRSPGLRALADAEGLAMITIADLADRMVRVPPVAGARVARIVDTTLPTPFGSFEATGFRDLRTGAEHVALVARPPAGTPADGTPDGPAAPPGRPALVRVHSECLTGDTLGSLRCDCGPQLRESLRAVAGRGGAVIYLRGHEGRGIGLLAKLSAYALQDRGRDTVEANLELGLPADAREYGAAAAVLRELGMERVELLTNNPAKVEGLREEGIDVVGRIGLQIPAGEHNARYLRTKRDLMGHLLDADALEGPRPAAADGDGPTREDGR